MTTQPKEPLLRMAKRDSISPRAAWGIRAAAFLLALITGGLLLLLLGHNPITVYSAMISGAWGSPTVARETVKIAVPLLITSIRKRAKNRFTAETALLPPATSPSGSRKAEPIPSP